MDDPQFSTDVPLDGWVTVRVDDDTVTCFSVSEHETLEVHLSNEKPPERTTENDT